MEEALKKEGVATKEEDESFYNSEVKKLRKKMGEKNSEILQLKANLAALKEKRLVCASKDYFLSSSKLRKILTRTK